jgi:hypothetical protein
METRCQFHTRRCMVCWEIYCVKPNVLYNPMTSRLGLKENHFQLKMRKELYQRRSKSGLCVTCATPLEQNHNTKKCSNCLKTARDYKKKTRDARRAEQERKYRSSVWFKRCLYRARKNDVSHDRVEEGPYMTPERLQTLRVLQLNKCFYCDKDLQIDNRRAPDGLTIERLSNDRPHSMANCVLCCHQCNTRRVSNHHTIDIHNAYYTILRKFEENKEIYSKFLQLIPTASTD